ncbi:MAG TPA: DUF2529 family protein [Oscillospiraceae bacterium]|nr:DUF2529 family protein [Oscillospiraceae bacterium]
MKMFKTQLTVGLNDKLTEKQEVKTSDAKMIIADTLLKEFGLFAFTMFTCEGVYTMASTGNTVFENSIRVEIATEDAVDTPAICEVLKRKLNQESIMVEFTEKEIDFL